MSRDVVGGEGAVSDCNGGDVLQSLLSVLKARRDLPRLNGPIDCGSEPQECVGVQTAMPNGFNRDPLAAYSSRDAEECEASGDVELGLWS